MRIFHDDVRDCPEGWTLARTNAEALELLRGNTVWAVSLDHDLGADPSEGWLAKGHSQEGSGLDLVKVMVAERLVPDLVIIHSWNPPGARRMARELAAAVETTVLVLPYRIQHYPPHSEMFHAL